MYSVEVLVASKGFADCIDPSEIREYHWLYKPLEATRQAAKALEGVDIHVVADQRTASDASQIFWIHTYMIPVLQSIINICSERY
jgi:hypothetical protein